MRVNVRLEQPKGVALEPGADRLDLHQFERSLCLPFECRLHKLQREAACNFYYYYYCVQRLE